MKEDYLWDKTGEDAEIQDLENALKAFRYRETAPPALEQKVFTLEKAKPRGLFQIFGFGFAALAAVVAVFSVVWFQINDSKAPVVEIIAENNAPKRPGKIAGDSFIAPPDLESAKTDEQPPKPSNQPKFVRTRQAAPPAAISPKKAGRPDKKAPDKNQIEPAETLTAEERYAYDQLMLALSITGSKLRIVQDKIRGIEEQNAVIETAK
jgi:hypothetical protein